MIIRTVLENGDWTFGKGQNNYLDQDSAIAQNIRSRLLSWEGDCFWDLEGGIDWRNLMDRGSQTELEYAIKTNIIQAEGVAKLISLTTVLDVNRKLTVTYSVETIYGATFEATITRGI